jgi:glycosyltransferase involved in cell wall biosynthesis
VNGVVRTLGTVAGILRERGHAVEVIGPDRFRTVPMPGYASIRLAVLPARRLTRLIDAFGPDAMHVATEGPLGLAARRLARSRGWRFTTSFHTRFAEYLRARTGVPTALSYRWLRRFHAAASGTMVATASLREELEARGFRNIRPWTRGVDLERFRPEPREAWPFPRPVFAYVGRVAIEKNIAAFLSLDLPGSKVVVGDGPQRAQLERRFPEAHFVGERHGESLSRAYAGSDAFVFPSRTDTFGLVLLESLACGTPVAAYPVTGPKDVVGAAPVGALDEDLRAAALGALAIDRAACRPYAERFSWDACADGFAANLVPLAREAGRAAPEHSYQYP